MHHNIQLSQLNKRLQSVVPPIEACVHCGFCLSACPTYEVLGEEMDSPRGRIILMKQVLEQKLEIASVMPHIDACLGCLACEKACPSGVSYRDMISTFREHAGVSHLSWFDRIYIKQTLNMLSDSSKFRRMLKVVMKLKWMKNFLPRRIHPSFDLLPETLPKKEVLQSNYLPTGKSIRRVGLLAGCAQQVLAQRINIATIEVLTRNGVEVVVPKDQGCCGALAWHCGYGDMAREHAISTIHAFPENIDAIIINAAGCGSGIHEYPTLLSGTEHESDAIQFVAKVIDISVYLHQLEIQVPAFFEPVNVAYHDACHLSHGQGIRKEPRELLQSIDNLNLIELSDNERCCGSAGIYNIVQPEIAGDLGRMKVKHIQEVQPDIVAAGNIGCMTQIESHLREAGDLTQVCHTIEIIAKAYRDQK